MSNTRRILGKAKRCRGHDDLHVNPHRVHRQAEPPHHSTAGGDFPGWRRDGKEFYYIAADQKLMAIPVKIGSGSLGAFEPGVPQPLFRIEPLNAGTTSGIPYLPAADGQRFLVNVRTGGEAAQAPPITVVLNWTAGLKK